MKKPINYIEISYDGGSVDCPPFPSVWFMRGDHPDRKVANYKNISTASILRAIRAILALRERSEGKRGTRQLGPESDRTCKWQLEDEDQGLWSTKCGNDHVFISGGPLENQYLYCPYCGDRLVWYLTEDEEPTTDTRTCFVCRKPVDENEAHWCHEPDCPNRDGKSGCDCDLLAHPECCPDC